MKTILTLLLLTTLQFSCSNIFKKNESEFINKSEFNQDNYNFKLTDYFSNNTYLTEITNQIFEELNDEERISQMIITSAGKNGKPEETIFKLIQNKQIGGIVLLGGDTAYLKNFIIKCNEIAGNSKSLPLLYSTDAEPSLINIKISNIEKFNPTNTIVSESESRNVANKISLILKEIGIQQNYSPVCDFSFNKDIIGNRSFGNDENKVVSLSKEFINSTQENNIVATAKHFPGHGAVTGDTHKQLVTINGEIKELNIFKSLIKDSVISIMVGHIAIKNNIKYNTDGLPATLSKKIVTDLLKNELEFKGLIITDGMNMKAVNNFETPSLKALEAGCDLILMPSDENKLLNSVLLKIKTNENFKQQIYDSVKKIIKVKICLRLIKPKKY